VTAFKLVKWRLSIWWRLHLRVLDGEWIIQVQCIRKMWISTKLTVVMSCQQMSLNLTWMLLRQPRYHDNAAAADSVSVAAADGGCPRQRRC